MKKTHADRIDLIDRLERKYARKVQLRQQREQKFKNALRMMRGRHFSDEDTSTDSIDGIFRHSSRATF